MEETEKELTVYPIGGLGEIGLNCLLLETATSAALIDCGLMFPDELHYGVDVVIPRLEFIHAKKDKLKGIVLTHGHEDHIGALPWLLPDINVPIFSSSFTLALVQNKFREFDLGDKIPLHPVSPREQVDLGDMRFHFFPVCHSIIQGYALGIETPLGRVLHSGDFKLDQNPLGGNFTDLEGIEEFSKPGVELMFSDSTNVERDGYALTEKEVKDSLQEVFYSAEGRILITIFSSHIQRIQEIYDLTRQFGKKLGVSGRSLSVNIEIARNLGYLDLSEEYFCNLDELAKLPDEEVVLLVTGSQGEPMSAMARLAEGNHRQLRIHTGDTVIISSRFIPGNTKTINRLINNLYRAGAEVVYEKVKEVHASGHAHAEELRRMLQVVAPRYFIPVHGEYRHLIKHTRLARDCGVAPERSILLEDGNPLTFRENGISFQEQFSAKSVLVDGKGVDDIDPGVLKERKLLADEGMVAIVLVVDEVSGQILMGPSFQTRGFIFEKDNAHVLEGAETVTLDVFDQIATGMWDKLRARIKSALRRYFRKTLDRDPVVVPIIVNIKS
ncbi:MAG: ribonuclease J [Thermodesulfobacteriota bacterium]